MEYGSPILYKRVEIPPEFCVAAEERTYGGDMRMGDLEGKGRADFLVYRSVDDAHDGGGMKPCFLGAFTADGEVLWRVGEGGVQPSRPGPVAIYDIDGAEEIICFFFDSRCRGRSRFDGKCCCSDSGWGEWRSQAGGQSR